MEWHESIKLLLSQGHDDEGEEDKKLPAQPPAGQQLNVPDLVLVVDNAKVHRGLHESQNTVAETRGSSSSSLDEAGLSVLFEEVDLYDDDQGFVKDMHHSFPFSRSRSRRRRRRQLQQEQEQQQQQQQLRQSLNEKSFASIGIEDDSSDTMQDVLARWQSNSDTLIDYDSIDYNSLDDMLREENSQTASARNNVFQPERRRSFEVSALPEDIQDMLAMDDTEDEEKDDGEMDCKPPARVAP